MKHIEEKDGKVFIDGIEYIPKENKEELPTCYSDIVKKHRYYSETGYVFNKWGSIQPETIESITFGIFLNENMAKAFLKLKNLLEIRDEYNNGWKPDWSDDNICKWNIVILSNKIQVDSTYTYIDSIFIFKLEILAQQFLKTHKKDLKFVFKYLYMWNPEN